MQRRINLDLALTEQQKMLQSTIRDFAQSEIKPLLRELDETGRFPMETFQKCADWGLTGVAIPQSEGGAGFDHVSYSIVIEGISEARPGFGTVLG
jgi:alkylation response protein AidB-like acyl-CoA dehydrogenase